MRTMFTIFFHIFCYDIWFYLSHIILHNRTMYKIHKIHHGKQHTQLIYSDTNVGHWFENIVSPMGIFFPIIFYIDPIGLCVSFVVVGVRALMRHDNRCSWLIGNHHILHHKYPQYNYGEYWLDTLFGTKCPIEDEYIYGAAYT